MAQTHHEWRCIVLDDCPDASARSIVERLGDERLHYTHNARPLGAIGNIDLAFRNRAMAGGTWALVLEDDNQLMPEHLSTQLDTCAREAVAVAMSAQLVEEVVEPGQPGRLSADKLTLAWIYPEGRHTFRAILPAVLFSHAFSNGAVFWRLGCASDFEIGDCTQQPGIQETLRLLKLRDDVYVSHRATAVWRSNDPRDSYVSAATSMLVQQRRQWQERREIADYRGWYLDRFGTGDALVFAGDFAPAHAGRIERALLLSGRHATITDRSVVSRLVLLAKGYAFRSLAGRRLRVDRLDTEASRAAGT